MICNWQCEHTDTEVSSENRTGTWNSTQRAKGTEITVLLLLSVRGNLLLKIEGVYDLAVPRSCKVPSCHKCANQGYMGFPTCFHDELEHPQVFWGHIKSTICKMKDGTHDGADQSLAFECQVCSCEYVEDMTKRGGRNCLRVSRYMNLGDGFRRTEVNGSY